MFAGLQSHDVEETALSHNLIARVDGAVNKDSDIWVVISVGQVELHFCITWPVSAHNWKLYGLFLLPQPSMD